MAGATNTIIQILRSEVTAVPSSLNPGEQAYSYLTNKLFIGDNLSGVLTIGGKYYVDLVDGATSANGSNNLVRRSDEGNAEFQMVSVLADASNPTDVVNKQFLETTISGLSYNTIYEGTVGANNYSNVHVSSADGGSIILVANNQTVGRVTESTVDFYNVDVGISGNLVVKGDTTYANVKTLLVDNNQLVMNANASGAPLIDAYITVNRGAADNAAIIWNESTDRWQVDRAIGVNYDIVDTQGGQSIGGTTTFSNASVTNGLHVGVLEVSGHSNVSSLTANGTIVADQVIVAANVQLANVANVSNFSVISHADSHIQDQHYIVLSHSVSGNNAIEANNLLKFDTANTTFAVGYSSYTPLPNTMYQGTGSSFNYVQNNLQNLNNEGSADWVATADNGSDETGYVDMGITGGNYNFATLHKPNDGFLQVVGQTGIGLGNLWIGTGTSNYAATNVGDVFFHIGNLESANIVGFITRENNSPTGAPTWALGKRDTANSAYTVDVSGAANVASLYINNTKVLGESFGLPVAFGGTGRTTLTANTVLYGTGTGAVGMTNTPTAGQVLQFRTDGVKFGGLDGGTF